ncbi:unnamed protein product [Orchesella dallaii]|uniref:J domain-containing protein n=1 Tax=Orchesella dallaii TaxID=48710 RepID=A0ABP1Q1R8_9HEXA
MVKEDTFYEVLEITRGNYTEEIMRQSYHSLLSFHASQVWENRDEGEEQLSIINRAYTTLCDPKKRFIYNTYGENGITRYEASIKNPYEKVAVIRFPLQVTPDQLDRGETIMFQVGRQICCRKCLGNGRLQNVCKKCEGLGGCMEIKVGNENNSNPYKENMIKCNVCFGINYSIGCEHCKGKGVVESSTTFHLTLDNTMMDGTILTLLDVGNEKAGLTTGNVEFEVKIFQRPVETQSDNAGPQPGTSDESSGNSPDNPRNDPGNGRIVDVTQSGNDMPHSSNQLAFPGHVNGWVRPMGHVRYLSQNGVCFQDGSLVGENLAYNGNFSGAVATGTTSAIETLGVAAVTVNAEGGCILALNNGTASEESSHNEYGENSSNSLALVQIPEGEQQQEHNDSGNRVGLDYSLRLG